MTFEGICGLKEAECGFSVATPGVFGHHCWTEERRTLDGGYLELQQRWQKREWSTKERMEKWDLNSFANIHQREK